MAFKMRGMSFVQGQSPMKKIGGKNYEKDTFRLNTKLI